MRASIIKTPQHDKQDKLCDTLIMLFISLTINHKTLTINQES